MKVPESTGNRDYLSFLVFFVWQKTAAVRRGTNNMQVQNSQWEMVLSSIAGLCREQKSGIIMAAIDGKSGSGKTTLAEIIRQQLGGNVFHMDDFFLRPMQRTEKRMREVGGNVDYERFGMILEEIRNGRSICYQAYDCKQQRLREPVSIRPARLNIIEGAYSMHPYFGNCYDVRIGMDIGAELQKERILQRSGEAMLQQFEKEWIPRENAYLKEFDIFAGCDIVVVNEKSEQKRINNEKGNDCIWNQTRSN